MPKALPKLPTKRHHTSSPSTAVRPTYTPRSTHLDRAVDHQRPVERDVHGNVPLARRDPNFCTDEIDVPRNFGERHITAGAADQDQPNHDDAHQDRPDQDHSDQDHPDQDHPDQDHPG